MTGFKLARFTCIHFTIFAALLALEPAPADSVSKHSRHAARVQTGLDVLESQKFAPLRGKHVGLITNHTGLDSQGRSTVDVLSHAAGVQLIALFSPEHGLAGRNDEKITSSKDPATGLPVHSLYGETLRPTDEMLKGIDALVFDVQDAGVRFYTYTATMAYCMEEAAKRQIAFFVLDRPNPLGGEIVEGPMLDADKTNFVGYFPLPVRYGLTIGELAQLFNAENHIGADLHVIAMKNWHRNYFFESTGIKWIPPSPNLRTTKGSILYPGIEILQNAGVSVGRGTQTPFEEFGAPWLNGDDVASALNGRHLPGLHFTAQPFIPIVGLYSGERCGGVAVRITERGAVRSMRMGLEIAMILHRLYPQQFDPEKLLLLIGNSDTIQQLQSGAAPEKIVASWTTSLSTFDQIRRKYFLYK
ncbi:MAG TPA: DUF1343 domain-containing protein [Candidatus Acidoferrales bacterium]|nr:DUF1343 domain-containing protein [Candidatus Acidoferrales bacterium]